VVHWIEHTPPKLVVFGMTRPVGSIPGRVLPKDRTTVLEA